MIRVLVILALLVLGFLLSFFVHPDPNTAQAQEPQQTFQVFLPVVQCTSAYSSPTPVFQTIALGQSVQIRASWNWEIVAVYGPPLAQAMRLPDGIWVATPAERGILEVEWSSGDTKVVCIVVVK